MLAHLLGVWQWAVRMAIQVEVHIAVPERHTFSRPAWVDSLSGGKETKTFPTECCCPIQPPANGKRAPGDSIVRSHAPGPREASPTHARLCGLSFLVSIPPHAGHSPQSACPTISSAVLEALKCPPARQLPSWEIWAGME